MKKLKVLNADDSSVIRKIVTRALGSGRDIAEVLEASNGAEALSGVQKSSLDLIRSDTNMPVMGGLEFLKIVAGVEAAKGVPVVMTVTEGSGGSRAWKPFPPAPEVTSASPSPGK